MRLAISNIAWDVAQDEAMAKLLAQQRINAIDIAPGKYFPHPTQASTQEVKRVQQWWQSRDIEITGMQSLLFGTVGLNMFGSAKVQTAMLLHLDAICRIAADLGATRLVFGSPKNRDRSGLDDAQTTAIAQEFFYRLGVQAQAHGVQICLEPNPKVYGANFMTHSHETAQMVRTVNHPAIRMQLDTGALTINGENIVAILDAHAELIGHIHASEPHLVPLGDGETNHAQIHQALKQHLPGHVVSIEMLTPSEDHSLQAITRALQVAQHNYGQSSRVNS